MDVEKKERDTVWRGRETLTGFEREERTAAWREAAVLGSNLREKREVQF